MKQNNITFKIASQDDSVNITALVNSVYRGENSKKGWTTEADFLSGIRITEEKVKEIIEGKNDVIILALVEESIIGCVHLENAGSYSYLGMLSVDVNFQDKGIGKLLITECERYTKEVFGLNEIKMKVISRRTELIEYYNRRGYSATSELEEFGSHGDTFGDTSEKLYFETLSKNL
ncbi:MAG: GNAT family N-acetyltransferase [Ignavibacteria bacterium]|nr:GNAT family N-acetyltransferase [Ignavibacteria bacterium]